MRKKRVTSLLPLGLILSLTLVASVGLAQEPAPPDITGGEAQAGTAFTYQGRLLDAGNPANGEYDLQFALYNALSGPSPVGGAVVKGDVAVSDGLFTVALDFGSVFDGTRLWLETAVRPGASAGGYTVLAPRQEITPAPYAIYALNIPWHHHHGASWIGAAADGLYVKNTSSGSWTGGLRGVSESGDNGVGVGGYADAASGLNYGVWGESWSSSGVGVIGKANATSGTTYGVHGLSATSTGKGVLGEATAASSQNYGVWGKSSSSRGIGVFGQAAATSSYAYGIWGESFSSDGMGVVAKAFAADGITYGVHASSASPEGTGVYGENTATSGFANGVSGVSASVAGVGGYFQNTGGGHALYLEGSAVQDLASNGLVKAGNPQESALTQRGECESRQEA